MGRSNRLVTLQVDDVILFRLYVNPLGGSYSAPRGAAPNHGGIYLGDGFMLHHPYNSTSKIADLEKKATEFGIQVVSVQFARSLHSIVE